MAIFKWPFSSAPEHPLPAGAEHQDVPPPVAELSARLHAAPAAAAVVAAVITPAVAKRDHRPAKDIDPVELTKATLRALSNVGAAGNTDANSYFAQWSEETDKEDPLVGFFRFIGKCDAETTSIAGTLRINGHPVPLCEFHSRLRPPVDFYRSWAHTDLVRRFHCVILTAYQREDLTSLVIASANPVAAGAVADHIRSSPGSDGYRPYVGLMRLSVADWRELLTAHFSAL